MGPSGPTPGQGGELNWAQAVILQPSGPWHDDCSQLCVAHICTPHLTGVPGEASMGMDRDRREREHLPLRRVEFHILLSLAAGERHGYGIIQDIKARDETAVPDVGTMYRALARMVENRLIEAAARRPAADAGDERRNYYRITDAGRRLARAEARRLEALTRAARIGGLLAKATK